MPSMPHPTAANRPGWFAEIVRAVPEAEAAPGVFLAALALIAVAAVRAGGFGR